MTGRPTTLERAYELAGSGECENVAVLKRRLKTEGFADVERQLYGPVLQTELRRLCREAAAK
ncbi:MAG TPA: hypothetical protein VGI95_12335 [Caulobacteraceae bacterium]|jgi:hypothetical protein